MLIQEKENGTKGNNEITYQEKKQMSQLLVMQTKSEPLVDEITCTKEKKMKITVKL